MMITNLIVVIVVTINGEDDDDAVERVRNDRGEQVIGFLSKLWHCPHRCWPRYTTIPHIIVWTLPTLYHNITHRPYCWPHSVHLPHTIPNCALIYATIPPITHWPLYHITGHTLTDTPCYHIIFHHWPLYTTLATQHTFHITIQCPSLYHTAQQCQHNKSPSLDTLLPQHYKCSQDTSQPHHEPHTIPGATCYLELYNHACTPRETILATIWNANMF